MEFHQTSRFLSDEYIDRYGNFEMCTPVRKWPHCPYYSTNVSLQQQEQFYSSEDPKRLKSARICVMGTQIRLQPLTRSIITRMHCSTPASSHQCSIHSLVLVLFFLQTNPTFIVNCAFSLLNSKAAIILSSLPTLLLLLLLFFALYKTA